MSPDMRTSSLTCLLTVCALIWAGIACACPPAVEPAPDDAAHQHHVAETPTSMLCAHAHCDDGGQVRGDACGSEPVLSSLERDGRVGKSAEVDSDDGNPVLVDAGTGPPPLALFAPAPPPVRQHLPRQASTPVQRKDQLTE